MESQHTEAIDEGAFSESAWRLSETLRTDGQRLGRTARRGESGAPDGHACVHRCMCAVRCHTSLLCAICRYGKLAMWRLARGVLQLRVASGRFAGARWCCTVEGGNLSRSFTVNCYDVRRPEHPRLSPAHHSLLYRYSHLPTGAPFNAQFRIENALSTRVVSQNEAAHTVVCPLSPPASGHLLATAWAARAHRA